MVDARSRLKAQVVRVRRADGRTYAEDAAGQRVSGSEAHDAVLIEAAPDPTICGPIDGTTHLCIGSQDAAENLAGLVEHDVVAILNVSFSDEAFPGRFRYLRVPLLDTPEQAGELALSEALDFIESSSPGKCLVHCNAGVSRSATVCVAYLMIKRGLDFNAALAAVRKARPSVRPNDGFMKWLQSL